MKLRDLTRDLYQFMYDDPLSYMQRMYPYKFDDLPESAKKEWDKEVLKIKNTEIEDAD